MYYFQVLLLDFVITCLIVLADKYVLICWQLDEMFGNYSTLVSGELDPKYHSE